MPRSRIPSPAQKVAHSQARIKKWDGAVGLTHKNHYCIHEPFSTRTKKAIGFTIQTVILPRKLVAK